MLLAKAGLGGGIYGLVALAIVVSIVAHSSTDTVVGNLVAGRAERRS